MLSRISADWVYTLASGWASPKQRVVDARSHIALGAQPLEHPGVARLVPGGEAPGVEVDHQA